MLLGVSSSSEEKEEEVVEVVEGKKVMLVMVCEKRMAFLIRLMDWLNCIERDPSTAFLTAAGTP
jgi:hypothetical protein